MKRKITDLPDPDYPKEITAEEEKAGFTLRDLHPGVGLPQNAVVLYVGENRIIKARRIFGGPIFYLFQISKEVRGVQGKFFADGVSFDNLQDALGQARLHFDLGDQQV